MRRCVPGYYVLWTACAVRVVRHGDKGSRKSTRVYGNIIIMCILHARNLLHALQGLTCVYILRHTLHLFVQCVKSKVYRILRTLKVCMSVVHSKKSFLFVVNVVEKHDAEVVKRVSLIGISFIFFTFLRIN